MSRKHRKKNTSFGNAEENQETCTKKDSLTDKDMNDDDTAGSEKRYDAKNTFDAGSTEHTIAEADTNDVELAGAEADTNNEDHAGAEADTNDVEPAGAEADTNDVEPVGAEADTNDAESADTETGTDSAESSVDEADINNADHSGDEADTNDADHSGDEVDTNDADHAGAEADINDADHAGNEADEYESEKSYPVYNDEVGDGRGYEPSDDGVDHDDELSEEEMRRKARRHKRRVAQRKAALITAVSVLIIAALAVLGIRKIGSIITQQNAKTEASEQMSSEAAAEESDIAIGEPSTETEAVETESVDYLGSVVDSCIQEMPIEDKVAQLFIITPEQLTGADNVQQAGDATQKALSEKAVGGIIYFKQNLKDKDQITEMLKKTSSMSKYPLFLAIDEEGGSVSRVAEAGIDGSVKVDAEASIGAGGDTSKAGEAGETIGSYLSALGFNLDFAPVADVVTDASTSSIGDRSYGADASVDGAMAAAMTEGLQKTGVSACLKHFPGLGDAEGDTHEQKVEITKTLDEMKKSDFISFKSGIDAGADFVMVGHGDVSSIDTSADYLPASMSSVMVTDELRGELGFNGIVVTDAMNMGAISQYFGADEAAVKAIEAGVDMILMPEDYDKAYNGILAAVKDGKITEDRINESLERIYRVKYADKIDGGDTAETAENTASSSAADSTDSKTDSKADSKTDSKADSKTDSKADSKADSVN